MQLRDVAKRSLHELPTLDPDWDAINLHIGLIDDKARDFVFIAKDDDKERVKRDEVRKAEAKRARRELSHDELEGFGVYQRCFKFPRRSEDAADMFTATRRGGSWTLARMIEFYQERGAAIFVLPNENDGSHERDFGAIRRIRALVADDDGGRTPDEWPLTPSLLIESSPGKNHVYFLVRPGDEPSVDEAAAMLRGIPAKYGTDPAVKDVPRVLRLAGTWNLKPGRPPFRVRFAAINRGRDGRVLEYSRKELLRAFPPVIAAPAANVSRADLDNIEYEAILTRSMLAALPADKYDGYDEWLPVGMALHDFFGGQTIGLQLWIEWSCRDDARGDVASCEKKWKSFGKRSEGAAIRTYASLCYEAAQNGWHRKRAEDKALEESIRLIRLHNLRKGA